MARCDYGDGDPLRWSPTVVELFMLDYLPRKVPLSREEVDALPEVLGAWVRFALTKRGLEERFILEVEDAVVDFEEEFREAMDDERTFGPGKLVMLAMREDDVDMTDQQALDAWLEEFNAQPIEERRGFFGPPRGDEAGF
jgi:hypothetical protein